MITIAELLIYGFVIFILLLSLAVLIHAHRVPSAREYYADEIAQIKEEDEEDNDEQ